MLTSAQKIRVWPVDINCHPTNGRKPHRLNNNHNQVMTPSSYGLFLLYSDRRSETYDSHVYLDVLG
jgi:hypothetical protein